MSKKHDRPIAGHEYDGIKELDNPLPKWWLATFYGAILFAILYWGYFEMGPGPSQSERLAKQMARITEAGSAAAEETARTSEDVDVAAIMADPAAMEVGKKQFLEKCAVCHGQNGEGGIGPNLTDKYWIHSKGDLQGILKSFREGFLDKGMPAWGPMIPPDEHVPLAVYVMSLQGTNPPNPKEPQGELVQ